MNVGEFVIFINMALQARSKKYQLNSFTSWSKNQPQLSHIPWSESDNHIQRKVLVEKDRNYEAGFNITHCF
jgi:hypothetical protein